MQNHLNPTASTYLFGVFSDLVDSVALEKCVKQYSNSQEAFQAVCTIIVSALLEKIGMLLEPKELEAFVSFLSTQPAKDKVRHWLDTQVPEATLHLTEAAEMAIFGITELQ